MAALQLPRLLPTTIAALAALLAMKSVVLVRAAVPQPEAAAAPIAQGPGQPAAAPSGKQGAEHGGAPSPKPGEHAAAAAAKPGPDHGAPPAKPGSPAMPASGQPAAAEPPPVSDAERAVLLDLRKRRQELDSRELALTARESLLAAAEQKLSARVEELVALQRKLEALEAARQQREEQGWQGLVKVYEAMKPRDAAVIFNDLQMPVLLAMLDRMKEAKAAPLLAAMNPDKAREVTAELAKLRMQRNGQTSAAAAAGPGG
jgi:flagellar motility protein MotE (MotC chaperone)